MPTQRLEYRILLSSPADLPDERRVVAEVVDELNHTWAQPNNAVLKLLRWEDIPPEFAGEPQEVINKGLGAEWDLYVGLMFSRFGTETKGYGSGTEEEFKKAYELWKLAPDKRKLLFYFKNASINVNDIDADQLSKVKDFKRSLGDLGGLYKEFTDASAFKNMLRPHLTHHLSELNGEYVKQTNSSAPTSGLDTSEPGLFDILEPSLAELNKLARIVNEIGEVMDKSTKQVNGLVDSFASAMTAQDLSGSRRYLGLISSNMRSMAKSMAEKRREYGDVATNAFDLLSALISVSEPLFRFQAADSSGFSQGIEVMIRNLEMVIPTLTEVERGMDGLPNLSKEFSSARLQVKREFANQRDEFNRSLSLLRELYKTAVDADSKRQ